SSRGIVASNPPSGFATSAISHTTARHDHVSFYKLRAKRGKTMRLVRTATSLYAALLWAVISMPALGASVFSNLDNSDLAGGGGRTNSNSAQASFAGAAGALATQSFESFAPGAVPGSFAIGGVTASFSSTATVASRIASGVSDFTTFPIGGSKFLYSESANGSTYFTVSFNTPVRALGFYASDLSDWAGSAGPIPNLQLNLIQASGGTSFNLLNGFDPTTVVN